MTWTTLRGETENGKSLFEQIRAQHFGCDNAPRCLADGDGVLAGGLSDGAASSWLSDPVGYCGLANADTTGEFGLSANQLNSFLKRCHHRSPSFGFPDDNRYRG